MAYYIGIDVGGTFTDGVVVDSNGNIKLFKTSTTPSQPSDGFMNCLREASEHYSLPFREFLGQVEKLTYGTTIATNILIENKGTKTGVITTRGFKDTLSIARIGREYLSMDLQFEKPAPLVPNKLVIEVTERVDYRGEVLISLNEKEVDSAIDLLVDEGVKAIAVCLLWSFKCPDHELRIRDRIQQKYPNVYVSLSHDVAAMMGEYERWATTVMNASLGLPIRTHLNRLSKELKENGLKNPLLIMQSNGGVIPAEDASHKPVTLLSSGPAGGVMASKYIAEELRIPNLICFDMGGTTLDVALINQYEYSTSIESRVYNQNIFMPMIDVVSIGSGGGSLAWLELGRRLKVGPQSAGAVPGPVCYGRGGTQPTVTDANLMLRYLNEDNFIGGKMKVERMRAEEIIGNEIANPLGMNPIQAAEGIVRIVEANMADCIRSLTIEKGYDPRDFTLIAYGGAGPVHACSLSRELGIKKVIIPYFATAQSAFGMVTSDIVHFYSVTDISDMDNPERLNQLYEQMIEKGFKQLENERISEEDRMVQRYVQLRYNGQVHQLEVQVPNKQLNDDDINEIIRIFEARYESLYGKGSAYREVGVEIVNLSCVFIGRTPKPTLNKQVFAEKQAAVLKNKRMVYLDGSNEPVQMPIYDGEQFKNGMCFDGPAIVEYYGTTIRILARQEAHVDSYRNLIVEER